MITHTRTVARLELSPAAYDEVRKKLLEAGYDHQFIKEEVEMIDMHGIGLVRGAEPKMVMVQNTNVALIAAARAQLADCYWEADMIDKVLRGTEE